MSSLASPTIVSFSPDSGIIGDGTTDADVLTLSGTAVANSTVSIFDGMALLGTATANPSGVWNFATGTLSSGSHTFIATDTYEGDTSQVSSALTVDTIPPSAPAIESLSGYSAITNGGMTADNVLTLGGTGEPDSAVTVFDGTKSLGTATVNSNGSWDFTTGQLTEGSHSLSAVDTDVAGNVSPAASPFAVTVETLSGGAPASIGVNMDGAEYSWGSFPTLTNLEYVKSEGVNLVRLPIAWEMMQPTLNGPLNASYLAGLEGFLNNAASLGIQVVVDLHNSGTYNLNWAADAAANYGIVAPYQSDASVLGSAAVPISAFANFWQQLATALNNNPAVASYDIMNEPNNLPSPTTWPAAAQAAVNAIRSVDMNTPITVEGDEWANAQYWQNYNANLKITDPANNIIYEAHTYFDNGSGQYALSYAQQGASANTGVQDVASYLQWLQENNFKGYVGEVGIPSSDPQWLPLLNNVLNTLQADGVSATLWNFEAAQPTDPSWWDSFIGSTASSNLNIAPINGQLNPVMALIFEHSAPVITSYSPNSDTAGDGITHANVLTLTGTGAGGAMVKVYDGQTLLGTTIASVNGSWSFTTGTLANGAHSFTATDVDASGDLSEVSSALSVTVETQAMAAPAIVSLSPDSGTVGDGITNATVLTLTGTAEANSTVKVYDGATLLGSATANGSGAWSYVTAALNDGAHSLTATDTDAAGNTSVASAPLAVTIDTTAPNAPVIAGDAIVNVHEVSLTGTAEANSTVNVYEGATLLGTATANGSGAWNFITPELMVGNHDFTATDTDAAGNTSALSQILDPTIDPVFLVAPLVSCLTPVGDGITNDNTLTLTGTAGANSTVNVYDGTTLLGTTTVNGSGAWSYTTAALADGAHSLTTIDTDGAGDASAASATLAVTIDTLAPTLAITEMTASAHSVSLTGTAEAHTWIAVYDSVSGLPLGTTTTAADGTWSLQETWMTASAVTVTATDLAGNTSHADASVPDPMVTSLAQAGPGTVTMSGTSSADSTVSIYDGTDSTPLGTVTADAGGAWSFTTGTLSNAVHDFTLKAVDVAGNTGSGGSAAIYGTAGNDTITIGSGSNLVVGNGGSDTFVFGQNLGKDVITDFQSANHDVLQFSHNTFNDFAAVLAHAAQVGSDVVITADPIDTVTLKNVQLASLQQNNIHIV